MKPETATILANARERWSLRVVERDNHIDIEVEGVEGPFVLSYYEDEHVIGTKEWHEHVNYYDGGLEAFLELLLEGILVFKVKYRGETPASHTVYILEDGKPRPVSKIYPLFYLFWRKASYRTFVYKAVAKPSDGNLSDSA